MVPICPFWSWASAELERVWDLGSRGFALHPNPLNPKPENIGSGSGFRLWMGALRVHLRQQATGGFNPKWFEVLAVSMDGVGVCEVRGSLQAHGLCEVPFKK